MPEAGIGISRFVYLVAIIEECLERFRVHLLNDPGSGKDRPYLLVV